VVLDESQMVKNPATLAARAARKLARAIACASPARRWRITSASCGRSSTS
jgi:hypothetical protein